MTIGDNTFEECEAFEKKNSSCNGPLVGKTIYKVFLFAVSQDHKNKKQECSQIYLGEFETSKISDPVCPSPFFLKNFQTKTSLHPNNEGYSKTLGVMKVGVVKIPVEFLEKIHAKKSLFQRIHNFKVDQ